MSVTVTAASGGRGIANRSHLDLASYGYHEREYLISGVAASFEPVGELGADGHWTVRRGPDAPYRTRMIVRAPAPERFSGVVLVEWLNVSAGADADPHWSYAHREVLRAGHGWVGVSAQRIGVMGGTSIVGQATAGLRGSDPERYGSLHHPGDAWSYDVFTQAVDALTVPVDGEGSPLGELVPAHLVAVGESQSAAFLSAYVNAAHPSAQRFHGFLVHSRGSAVGTLDGSSVLGSHERAVGVRLRTDDPAPVLIFETETDLTVLRYATARQPDAGRVVTWEVAGTAHADEYLLVEVVGLGASELQQMLGVTAPVNSGPHHEVLQAGLRHLVAWVRDGTRPPTSPRIELASLDPPVIARDEHGNALGGIRTPLVDVPVETLSGDPAPDAPGYAFLFGRTLPFDDATLSALYPDAATYLDRFERSLQATIAAGFVLAEDAEHLRSAARRRAARRWP